MPSFAENLARAADAAATGAAPAELVRWLAQTAIALAPVVDRARARNVLLREAAARVPGSRWAKAKWLEREIAVASWRREQAPDRGNGDARALVARAMAVGPRARLSLRHLLALLAG